MLSDEVRSIDWPVYSDEILLFGQGIVSSYRMGVIITREADILPRDEILYFGH